MTHESLQNLYAKNLRQRYGYPLRFPEPSPSLPSSYADHGLQIGDVGYVDDEGMFMVLFNIRFLRDHELHRNRPKLADLVGLIKFESDEVSPRSNAIPSTSSPICHGIQCPAGHDRRRFTSYSTSGAVLVLPSGAARQKLPKDKEEEFRKLAEKHALDWCHFARCNSLYLITGFYKTNRWRLASFHDVAPTGQVILEGDGTRDCDWHSKCDVREGGDNSNENQTVFISGFKIEVGGWYKPTPRVEKLWQDPGSIWPEWPLLLTSLGLFLSFLWQWVVNMQVTCVPALSQPFHPSDIINRYLLDKNPNARVAITHDDEWLSMLEEDGLSHEVMLDAGCFRAFLEEKYSDDANTDNVVYLRRKIDKHNNEGSDGLPVVTSKTFSMPTAPYETRQFVITRMRAENIATCLRWMPVGFYVSIQINGTVRRSKCNPASLCHNIIEWDDKIVLPTQLMAKIQLSITASFEFKPMLGNGEVLCMLEMSVDKLAAGKSTHFLFSPRIGEDASLCPSLLITIEERRFNSFSDWSRNDNVSKCEGPLPIEVVEETDKGHNALLRYHEGQDIKQLNECLECFKLALDHCPPGHECSTAALFNLTTGRFIHRRIRGIVSDLDDVISSYRKVLELRPGHHPDRPRTLLHLAQTLLYRQGKLQYESSIADEIERLATEIKQICPQSSYGYDHRAADLVSQTLKRYQVLTSGKLAELEEFISELHWSAQTPPDCHFDRSLPLMNFGIALRKYFEITGHIDHIEKSISTIGKALQLVSEDHLDRPWMLASLGDAHRLRFVQRGDIVDLDSSISMIEGAMKILPDGHFDKSGMLASLGDAFRVRFVQSGDAADLDRSISMIEQAMKFTPDGHFDKPRILSSLGVALRARFAQCGDVADLTRSISMIEQAVKLTPDGHFDKPRMLVSLDDSFRLRPVHSDVVADPKILVESTPSTPRSYSPSIPRSYSPSLDPYLSPTKPPVCDTSTRRDEVDSPFRALPLVADDLKTTRISVLHSSIRPNDRGKEVSSFEIKVYPGNGKEPWKVEKLYSDVLVLDHRLRAAVGKVVSKEIAALPEGRMWKDHAPVKSDQRKVALKAYLQSWIDLPVKNKDVEVIAFLTSGVVRDAKKPVTQVAYKEGYLTKRGKNFGRWKTRYFVLQGPTLEYYRSRGGAYLGSIVITNAQIGRQQRTSDDDDNTDYRHAFLIIEAKKRSGGFNPRHVLCAESDSERDSWVEILVRYVTGTFRGDSLTSASIDLSPVSVNVPQTSDPGSGQPHSNVSSNRETVTMLNGGRVMKRDDVSRSIAIPTSQLMQDRNSSKFSRSTSFTGSASIYDSYRSSPLMNTDQDQSTHEEYVKRLVDHKEPPLSSSLLTTSALEVAGKDLVAVRSSSELGHHADVDRRGVNPKQEQDIPESSRSREAQSSYHPGLVAVSGSPTKTTFSNRTPSSDLGSPPSRGDDLNGKVKISGSLGGAPNSASYKSGSKHAPPEGISSSKRREMTKLRSFWNFRRPADRPSTSAPRVVFGVPLDESLDVAEIARLPAVVFRCIQYLEAKKADQEEAIYSLSGRSTVIKDLRDRFNTESDVDLLASDEYWDLHAIAGLLKGFLRELPDSILTRDLHTKFLSVTDFVEPQERIRELSHLIASLPIANYNLLRALTAHLILIIKNSSVNKMTMPNVCTIFRATLGIPPSVFSLMLAEFNRVFDDAANDVTEDDADNNGDRNSRQCSDVAADELLGLAGRILHTPIEEISEEGDNLSIQYESGNERKQYNSELQSDAISTPHTFPS